MTTTFFCDVESQSVVLKKLEHEMFNQNSENEEQVNLSATYGAVLEFNQLLPPIYTRFEV